MRRNRNKPQALNLPPKQAVIESLDQEGRGVTHLDGKVIFVQGALPGETIQFVSDVVKPSYEIAHTVHILKPSNQRVTPKCPHFGVCGGCALQHLDAAAQVAAKQRLLESSLQHIGQVSAESILPPLYGPIWEYRHKARLRVRYVAKKGGVLVGFNEKTSSYVTFMNQCEVLPPHISALIPKLKILIGNLSIREQIPQIEIAIGEASTVLVFRILQGLQAIDLPNLEAFSKQHDVQIWTQTKGPDTVAPLFTNNGATLSYSLPEFNLTYPFNPTEFTQVNPHINRVMIRRAMQLLQPQAHERIADFFCGLGNFTLPIARSGANVYGIEGSASLVKRAEESAQLNGLAAYVRFETANLFEMTTESLIQHGYFDKWLIDPPRDGAMELIKAMPDNGKDMPTRIVYVSCNPATLARDAGILVNMKGYQLKAAGVINMFPHTAHVESIALFERK